MAPEPDLADREESGANSHDLAGGHSKAWAIGAVLAGAGLIAWFLVAWLALGRESWDAAGESVLTGLILLLVITVVGAVRRR